MNKKLLLCSVFSAALLLSAGIVNAAPEAPSLDVAPKTETFHHGKHGVNPLEDKLGLTDEQKEKAKKIHEDGRKEIEPLVKEMKEIRDKMDAVRKKNMEEFEKILTPEQKTKLDEMKAKMGEKMKKFKGKHGHHRMPGMLPPHEDGMLPPPPHDGVPPAPEAK